MGVGWGHGLNGAIGVEWDPGGWMGKWGLDGDMGLGWGHGGKVYFCVFYNHVNNL